MKHVPACDGSIRQDASGMTLIEIMVAVVIITFAALGLIMFMQNNVRSTKASYALTTATQAATSAIQELEAKLSNDDTFHEYVDSVDVNGGAYITDPVVDTVNSVPLAKVATITLNEDKLVVKMTVSWKDDASSDHSVKMGTIVLPP
ncbi:MAG: prepilin-type N-terminal cleavage/methylation domain-containing protein [Chitinivibrionales bacterium]|nr:prepilin-type N-terminal cleavage/methylation domain-containing protein [Chitinivibrionales bacterium]